MLLDDKVSIKPEVVDGLPLTDPEDNHELSMLLCDLHVSLVYTDERMFPHQTFITPGMCPLTCPPPAPPPPPQTQFYPCWVRCKHKTIETAPLLFLCRKPRSHVVCYITKLSVWLTTLKHWDTVETSCKSPMWYGLYDKKPKLCTLMISERVCSRWSKWFSSCTQCCPSQSGTESLHAYAQGKSKKKRRREMEGKGSSGSGLSRWWELLASAFVADVLLMVISC